MTGTVVDEDGMPIPGVSVVLKGTDTGVMTDVDGRFTLKVPSAHAGKNMLTFSFVGMKKTEMTYKGKPLRVTLEEDVATLGDVVVNGYFQQAKNSFTGAARTITQEELQQGSNQNILSALQNIDPSFMKIENNAMGSNPNVVPDFQIRGSSSISSMESEYDNNPNMPVFIVDGFEMSADFAKQLNKDWFVSFKGTFTFARNKVIEYDEGAGTRSSLSQIGKKLNSIMGYVADGLYIDEADIANSAQSTDRVVMGHPTVPEIVYGFGPSIVYKNWDFSFFFQGAANVSLMMSGFAPFGASYNRNVLSWIADDYWSPSNQNPNAAFPRLTQYNSDHNMAASSYWLRNAAFLKLKNIELGYTFKRARFYISAVNLFTISPFKLWDPEMGGGAGLSYPTQRTFNIGVQVTL